MSECPKCGDDAFTYKWKWFHNGTTHIEVRCFDCGNFIEWAAQTPDNVNRAGERPKGPPPVEPQKPSPQGRMF